jgi:NADH dehydrogenase
VSLGENKGVGALMGGLGGPNFFVEGLIAKWAYISLHLDHHRAIMGTPKTATWRWRGCCSSGCRDG